MKTRTELLEQLEIELQALQAKTYRAGKAEEVSTILESILGNCPKSTVACEDRPFLRDLHLGYPVLDPLKRADRRDEQWAGLKLLQAGITGVDYALADTGTLILFSGNSGGRGLSLAPPVHIALLPIERILPTLDDFLEQFVSEEAWLTLGSAVIFISGASRTADIELNLVHGAHGPKELHVISLVY
jgi:L-lactate dehydrogenase complex protein LldG